MTVSMETVRKAKSQPRKNQSYQNAWICFKTILSYNKYEYLPLDIICCSRVTV